MIDKTFIPVNGLKKEPYSGSHRGMRYYFKSDNDGKNFSVTVYPEPWSFEKTADENKESSAFPLNEEGMDAAIAWLWEKYEDRKGYWQNSSENSMHIVFDK